MCISAPLDRVPGTTLCFPPLTAARCAPPQVTGRPVVVKLNTGVDYRGVLACLDGYMNIAMEQVRCSRVRACVAV